MNGKHFTTPSGGRTLRYDTYALQHTFAAPSATRWNNVAGAPERPAHEGVHNSHVRSHSRPSRRTYIISGTTTPERRQRGILGSRAQSTAPGTSVHHMLNELVDLSYSIAALLEQESLSTTPAVSSSARQQEAGLKTQEIERIVRRVEAHFMDKIQTLEATNTNLKDEIRQLREALQQAQAPSEDAKITAAQSVRGGLKEEIEALDALDKTWASEGNDTAGPTEAVQLRRVLLAEKRQRLRVEEQTQSLTEQHAKVVGTLERRLKKQEEQLYDLIAAIDRGYSGTGLVSPARSTERSSSHRLQTPRHLLRQQLAQHQQTQRALQEYKENLRYETPSPMKNDDVAAMEELGLGDVCRTLESVHTSEPLIAKEKTPTKPEVAVATSAASHPQEEPEIVYTSVSATNAKPPTLSPPSRSALAQRTAPISTREVDEITSYLDNIIKELDSLDAA